MNSAVQDFIKATREARAVGKTEIGGLALEVHKVQANAIADDKFSVIRTLVDGTLRRAIINAAEMYDLAAKGILPKVLRIAEEAEVTAEERQANIERIQREKAAAKAAVDPLAPPEQDPIRVRRSRKPSITDDPRKPPVFETDAERKIRQQRVLEDFLEEMRNSKPATGPTGFPPGFDPLRDPFPGPSFRINPDGSTSKLRESGAALFPQPATPFGNRFNPSAFVAAATRSAQVTEQANGQIVASLQEIEAAFARQVDSHVQTGQAVTGVAKRITAKEQAGQRAIQGAGLN